MSVRLAYVEAQPGACAIPDEVSRAIPTGDKILVLVEAPPEMTQGGLVKPQQVIDREMGGSGWIITLGPDAGELVGQAAVALSDQESINRGDLVGAKVVWGRYGGEALVVTERDDEFKSRFRIIKEEHIMCVLALATPE